jgi:hypothetical protein
MMVALLTFALTGSILYQKTIHVIFAFAMCVAALRRPAPSTARVEHRS